MAMLLDTPARSRDDASRRRGIAPRPPVLTPLRAQLQLRCSCGGGCPKCAGAGAAEREADRAAAQVMGMPQPAAPAVARPLPPAMDGAALERGGVALPAALRAFYEPRFGHDFGGVRLHADAPAHAQSERLHAAAFTYGRHVWLGRGQTPAPSLLMAHELAHVVQQSGGAPRVQRQPAPPSAPVAPLPAPVAQPLGCDVAKTGELALAFQTADKWLAAGSAALRAYAGAPADAKHASTAGMLQLHLHRADASMAGSVADVFDNVRAAMSLGAAARAGCAAQADAACAGGADAAGDRTTGKVSFCPDYFGKNGAGQANTAVHEYAHLFAGKRVVEDRAYGYHRRYAFLTPEEAFDNAESFSNLAQDLGSGQSGRSLVGSGLPADTLTACDNDKVARALAKVEGWTVAAFRVVSTPAILAQQPVQDELRRQFGNASAATVATVTLALAKVGVALEASMDVQCHAVDDARCTAGLAWSREAPSGARKANRWHLCKTWAALADDTARGASFFSFMLQGVGGATAASAAQVAAFSRAIDPMLLPAPPAITPPQPTPPATP